MNDRICIDANGRKYINNEPRLHELYKRRPLTYDEIRALIEEQELGSAYAIVRAVERAHGIK